MGSWHVMLKVMTIVKKGEGWKDREKEKMNHWGGGLEEAVYEDRRMSFLTNLDVFVPLLCATFYGHGQVVVVVVVVDWSDCCWQHHELSTMNLP